MLEGRLLCRAMGLGIVSEAHSRRECRGENDVTGPGNKFGPERVGPSSKWGYF
jgi:hypothetical protein